MTLARRLAEAGWADADDQPKRLNEEQGEEEQGEEHATNDNVRIVEEEDGIEDMSEEEDGVEDPHALVSATTAARILTDARFVCVGRTQGSVNKPGAGDKVLVKVAGDMGGWMFGEVIQKCDGGFHRGLHRNLMVYYEDSDVSRAHALVASNHVDDVHGCAQAGQWCLLRAIH